MRYTRFSCAVFVALSLFIEVSLSQNVLDLVTESNFDSAAKGQNPLLVDFYAPWCPHCRDILPFFEKAAAQLKSELPQVTLAKVDCTKSKALCEKYDVKYIPRIQLFYQGQALEKMQGDKTLESIVSFAKTSFKDASSTLRKLIDKANSAQAVTTQG